MQQDKSLLRENHPHPKIEAAQLIAPLESYKKALFKRLLYSVWTIVTIYSVFYGSFGAQLAFWTVFAGTIFLCPVALLLELKGRPLLARTFFILSCNAYIYLTSAGMGHNISAEYYYIPATMIPILLFDDSQKRHIFASVSVSFLFWVSTVTLGSEFIPDAWIVRGLPFGIIKNVNFTGALMISLVFLSIFVKTNHQLKELLVSQVKKEAETDKTLSKQLAEAQKLSKLGSWQFDLKTQNLTWSSEHYRIFEIEEPQAQENLFRLYRERIHPEDLPRLDRLITRAIERGEEYVFDHRVLLDHGKRIKYVQGIGKVTQDASGVPVMISGTCQDLTEQ